MRFDKFDLNLLVALDALLNERNVTRASERLHISQSGASAALSRLREHFADELLVPVGRTLVLTPLAQSLVQPVHEALLHVRSVLTQQPQFDPATAERRFTVCASDYGTTILLGHVVQRLASLAPHMAIDIRRPPKDVMQSFEKGGVDLLLLPLQYVENLPHPSEPLFEDDHVGVVWSGHTSIKDDFSLEQYMEQGHVVVRFGDERSVSFEEWFLPRYGQQRRIACSVDNFSTVPLLLIGTQRVATLHKRMAQYFARDLPLRLVPLPFSMPSLVEAMSWPRHLENDPAHKWLREQLHFCVSLLSY